MKLSPYRTCDLCAHFAQRRNLRTYCVRDGRYVTTRPGDGCKRFQARDERIEDAIRDLEIARHRPVPMPEPSRPR